MKAIMVMFDSLNREMLSPYGCEKINTPNFEKLAERSVQFNRSYAGSLPCMPARRELHTGRYNFLHRSWGPMEPYDKSMPEILKNNGIHSHLISDHSHYWEEGGCNYHTKYSTWEIVRGQEGDPYHCDLNDRQEGNDYLGSKGILFQRDQWNRKYIIEEKDFPLAQTFHGGLDFIRTNYDADNWFLQIEAFDPHEPFFSSKEFKEMYGLDPDDENDWPEYRRVKPGEDTSGFRNHYKALVTMCDRYLGKVMDRMDEYDMWVDTMLIVNTDHGFLLGEHDWWGKSVMSIFNEIANTPLFIWDPVSGCSNETRECLAQTIDIAPTLLEHFGQEIPEEMLGKPLQPAIKDGTAVREDAIFGVFGCNLNYTDGRYVYMKGTKASDYELYQYTLMPTHMRSMFSIKELKTSCMMEGFDFTQGLPLMKIDALTWGESSEYSYSGKQYLDMQSETMIFDLEKDPEQKSGFRDKELEHLFDKRIRAIMEENDAPVEQYQRFGLE